MCQSSTLVVQISERLTPKPPKFVLTCGLYVSQILPQQFKRPKPLRLPLLERSRIVEHASLSEQLEIIAHQLMRHVEIVDATSKREIIFRVSVLLT